ncbi:hypothetical protein SmJEL517_g01226 [Synchytrium microbalum]|uniref:Sm domain-containing protein n=1 Tax=Synchytrium microbalum TaxID=1806994 RepID=A0A507CFC9_9FUNG|nr:uncharacterized protein SmJEL517_g01226 [Synchytrium microbalum]TPX36696.1 hypothetical protein SmJEL517_g01226 [Synchytrium microbalum]
MADRGRAQSRGGGGRGSSRGQSSGGRGGRGGGSGNTGGGARDQGPKREAIIDLAKYMDKQIRVKFMGGREVVGSLKGYDPLLNLVLDDCVEHLRDPEDHTRLTKETRNLGLLVCRGTTLVLISPVDGSEQIPNPFMQAEDE